MHEYRTYPYRGRGEKTERVDAFYEVRDVTSWTPPPGPEWWEHLPSGDDAEWQARASRRKQQTQIRLAFVCRKNRWGAEAEPFVVEIDFETTPWTLIDVTDAMIASGERAAAEERHAASRALEAAADALARYLRDNPNEVPLSKKDAEAFLCDLKLKRAQARNLLESFDAETYPDVGKWNLRQVVNGKGKIGVYPLTVTTLGGEL